MFKLLVADDEALERRAIRYIIQECQLPIEVVGEARNGVEVVELAEKLKPDIILMDIKMPSMDGIKATTKIKECSPWVKIVIVSAYDEFEYAVEAIKLGAADYLLKPARPEEIVRVLNKVMAVLEEERLSNLEYARLLESVQKAMPYFKMSFVFNLISGDTELDDLDSQAKFLGIEVFPSIAMVIAIDHFDELAPGQNEIERQILKQNVFELVNECMAHLPLVLTAPLGGGKIVVLLSIQSMKEERVSKKIICELAEKIRETVERQTSVTVTVGIGRHNDHGLRLREYYLDALKAFKLGSLILGGNQVVHIDDLQEGQEAPYPINTENSLCDRVKYGEWKSVKEELENLLHHIMGKSPGSVTVVCTRLAELTIMLSRSAIQGGADQETILNLNVEFIPQLITCNDLEEMADCIMQLTKKFVNAVLESRKTFGAQTIKIAQKYIEKKYQHKLSLEEVARAVHLTPHYFSRLFKKETGYSFVEYLTQIRLNKAKLLLCDPSVTINDIAEKIGYPDANYFSRVFKKVEGLSPSEYRNKAFIKRDIRLVQDSGRQDIVPMDQDGTL